MRQSLAVVWTALALAAPPAVSGAEIEWFGTADWNFHNAANWAGGAVPGAGDTAVIDANAGWQSFTLGESIHLDRLLIRASGGVGTWHSVSIYGESLLLNDLTIDSGGARMGVTIGGEAKTSQLTFLTGQTGAEYVSLNGHLLYVEGGKIRANGEGHVSLSGLVDITGAGENVFDVIGSTSIHFGGSFRIAGQVDNVGWLPPQVELTTGPGCLSYVYEQGDDETTIHVLPRLQAGDADMDFDHDQLDMVQVLQAGKYLTGEPASWGEGDWDGAPGGCPGNPPPGNGLFDQIDVIAALSNSYLTGPYAGLAPTSDASVPVPESSTLSLAALAFAGLLRLVWRRLRRRVPAPR